MASADFMEGGIEEFPQDEDDYLDDRSHKKLLSAVSSLYRKQRIAAPKRNEPSLQISEFNLSKAEQKKKLVPTELLKGLGSNAIHKQIHNKIKAVKSKLKPLPKPLEKLEAEKINRETGYENVKEEVSKWDATIQKNRAADRLTFPLRNSVSIKMEPERDILATFSKPTELELKMAEVLNKSSTLKELKEEAQAEKLTIAQLIHRRNMIAKMRHRESYRIAKAVRQNKIKSKKYHRMLKRDRIRNELKEFELLQKTDPEAALAKLEKVERARAEERISLRHRNTGKWAKGLAIRAKYDVEARAQLADNLRKSRELTDKVKASMVSDSDDEAGSEDDMELDDAGKSGENPWVNPGNEVASFVKGYRKFWEEKSKSDASQSVVGIKRDAVNSVADRESDENESDGSNEGVSEIEEEAEAPEVVSNKKITSRETEMDKEEANPQSAEMSTGDTADQVSQLDSKAAMKKKNGTHHDITVEAKTCDVASSSDGSEVSKTDFRKAVKAPKKLGKKKIVSTSSKGKKLANTGKVGINSKKRVRAGKPSGGLKYKTHSGYFKITENND